MDLEAKRTEAIESLENLKEQANQIAILLERTVGRIATLNELIAEQDTPTQET